MATADKKWILDFSPLNASIETPETEFEVPQLKSLPTSLFQVPLFIDSASWLPITVEEAMIRLNAPDYIKEAGYKHLLNSITISFSIRLYEFTQNPHSDLLPNMKSSMEEILRLLQKMPLNAEIKQRTLEMLDEFHSAASRFQNKSSELLPLNIVKTLVILSKELHKFPLDFRLAWQKRLFDSQARNALAFHPTATLASEYLLLEILIAVSIQEDGELPDSTVQKLATVIPNDPSKIHDFLPSIIVMARHTNVPFLHGSLSTYFVLEVSNISSKEARLGALKAVDFSDFLSSTVSLLMTPSPAHYEPSLQALEFWLSLYSDYATMEAVLDEITVSVKTSHSVLTASSSGAKLLTNVKKRLSQNDSWRYIHHWLLKFGEMSDLDLVLTRVASLDDIKPYVNALEIGLSVLHYITPEKCELAPSESQTDDFSKEIDVQVYHSLMDTLLSRMDVPDYFFYLGETKDYDQDNFRFNDMRVKTFQHLIGHYWHLMDSLLANMPNMKALTQDNPILLMPAGVEAPTQVPPWLDTLFVVMAIHSMPSDFSTKETYLDVKKAIQTLLSCESVKSLKKSPFALRIRQVIQLTKSRQKDLLDDAAKFSILTWLCRQVPLHELSPNTDSYDRIVVNTVVSVINEVLGDHRPRIKILAIHLVLSICNQKSIAPSGQQPVSIQLPRAIFDSIVHSLNFREVPLVDMALKTCMALIKSQIENETKVAWAEALMQSIKYEMDYIQKKELLVLYLEHLKGGILEILGIQIFLFSHPLMVRLVSLLDIGDFQLTQMALESMEQLMRLAWPRIHLESELIFGALGAVWIDQVLILPTDAPATNSERLQNNISLIKDRIRQCLLILIQILEPKLMAQMAAQVEPLAELKSFHDMIMELITTTKSLK